jgi:hypothetical protein
MPRDDVVEVKERIAVVTHRNQTKPDKLVSRSDRIDARNVRLNDNPARNNVRSSNRRKPSPLNDGNSAVSNNRPRIVSDALNSSVNKNCGNVIRNRTTNADDVGISNARLTHNATPNCNANAISSNSNNSKNEDALTNRGVGASNEINNEGLRIRTAGGTARTQIAGAINRTQIVAASNHRFGDVTTTDDSAIGSRSNRTGTTTTCVICNDARRTPSNVKGFFSNSDVSHNCAINNGTSSDCVRINFGCKVGATTTMDRTTTATTVAAGTTRQTGTAPRC